MSRAENRFEETKQRLDTAKAKAEDFVRPIVIETTAAPLPPVKISNDFNINDLEKPTAFFLFREDFAPENKLSFNGKFRSRWQVKFNAGVAVGGSFQNPTFDYIDDAQLNGPVGNTNLQVKIKPKRLTAQLDFGHHLVHNDVELRAGHKNIYAFFNPYVYFECDRALRNHLYGLGLMTYFNKDYRDHWRLNFTQTDRLNWDLIHNMLIKHRGFFLNWIVGLTYKNALLFNDRRLMFGYDRDQVNANLELVTKKGTFTQYSLDNATAAVSYDFKERGLLGLLATTAFGDGPDAKRVDDFAFGYRNKLRRDLEFKAKLSARGIANFFFNYRVQEGLNLHTSFLTSLVERKKNGFLTAPFDFGLKIKFEN